MESFMSVSGIMIVDILFNIIPNGSGIIINSEYKISIFSEDQIKQLMNRFVELIELYVK